MPHFRKKSVVIEARRVPHDAIGVEVLRKWVGGRSRVVSLGTGRLGLVIPTPSGEMTAQVGDWVICGVKGNFYLYKPDIFEATYERVTDLSHQVPPADPDYPLKAQVPPSVPCPCRGHDEMCSCQNRELA